MALPKVFINCPINERKSYALDDYFSNILNFTYPNKQYCFVDNSPQHYYSESLVAKYGIDIYHYQPNKLRNVDYMKDCLNILRDMFLKSECEYFFSLECDLFPPLNIIEILMCHDKPIVTAPYFIGSDFNYGLCKTEIEEVLGKKTNRHISGLEGYLSHTGELELVDACGIGCALIKREIIEDIGFMTSLKQNTHADTFFYFDLHDRGIEVWQDTSLIIEHRNRNWNLISDYK